MAKKNPAKKSIKKSPKKDDAIATVIKDQWSLEQLESVIFQVKSSKSSVFSKEDVVSLLGEIKESFTNRKDAPKIDKDSLIEEITDNVCRSIDEGDIEDMDLSLSGNEIVIDSLTLAPDRIREYVEEAIDSYL